MESVVDIEALRDVTAEDAVNLNALMQGLKGDEYVNLSIEEIRAVISNTDAAVIVARKDARIVGVVTLYSIRKIGAPTGLLVDLIVSQSHRRKGIGAAIVQKALATASERGLRSVSLTSRYVHGEAHSLYKKLGFEKKESAVFRYKLR